VGAIRHLSTSTLALVCVAGAQPAQAQSAVRQPCDLMALSPKQQPLSLHANIVSALQGSTVCLARKDAPCADELLSQVDATSLSTDEQALLTSLQADVAELRGDHDAAAKLFREALEKPTLGAVVKSMVAVQYANTLFNANDYAGALRVLDAGVACETWTAQALVTRAAAYLRIFAPELAEANLDAATRLYRLEGREAPPIVKAVHKQAVDVLAEQKKWIRPPTADALFPGKKVPPNYPVRALGQHLEGWVQFEFSVSDNGIVENARVVGSSNEIFERPGLDSLKQWRFAPPLEDGLPVRSDGVKTVLRWQLR
jgi:TonB family protein